MIPVEFRLDPKADVYAHLVDCADAMPWLDYLCKNCAGMKIREIYDTVPYQIIVTYEFDLDPKKETYYRIKYGDGL